MGDSLAAADAQMVPWLSGRATTTDVEMAVRGAAKAALIAIDVR